MKTAIKSLPNNPEKLKVLLLKERHVSAQKDSEIKRLQEKTNTFWNSLDSRNTSSLAKAQKLIQAKANYLTKRSNWLMNLLRKTKTIS